MAADKISVEKLPSYEIGMRSVVTYKISSIPLFLTILFLIKMFALTINAPSHLTFSNLSSNSVTLNWQDNSNNETGFKVFRDNVLIFTTDANVTTYTDTNLTPNTAYTYTVKATVEPNTWYHPDLNDTWQWQLQGDINDSYNVSIYDIDLFDTSEIFIETLRQSGKKVMCYFSAGSYEEWREDAHLFQESELGNELDGWDGERWLDIRSENVKKIMLARLDTAQIKGCDGVEPDNMDGYTNNSGFDFTAEDQLIYNQFLANEAHKRGLFIALKNDLNQIPQLVNFFDLAVNEQCHQYNECDLITPFINAGKPVFNAEYNQKYLDEDNMTKLCNTSNTMGFQTLILPLALDDSFRYSCKDYLYQQQGVGFGGSNAFKFHDNKWLNSVDLMFGQLDNYKNQITDFNEAAFTQIGNYLRESRYIVYWFTKTWQENWFSPSKIQYAMDNGKIPVFNYWYFGDELMNGLPDDFSTYYTNVTKVANFLSNLQGTKLLIMEPEFNKQTVLDNPAPFIEVMQNAIDIIKVKDPSILISLCMTDTGSRGVNQTYAKCGYANCALGDQYEWALPETIYTPLLEKLDFISFQEMVAQFSRDPQNPGTWDTPNPKSYTNEEIGINYLAQRIDNFANFLKEKYQKPVFLPYITIATATWNDINQDNMISSDEINTAGWEQKATQVYQNLQSNTLFGYAAMALFDDPVHDQGGYQYFMENEYHLGLVKSTVLENQPTGDIIFKGNILKSVFGDIP